MVDKDIKKLVKIEINLIIRAWKIVFETAMARYGDVQKAYEHANEHCEFFFKETFELVKDLGWNDLNIIKEILEERMKRYRKSSIVDIPAKWADPGNPSNWCNSPCYICLFKTNCKEVCMDFFKWNTIRVIELLRRAG